MPSIYEFAPHRDTRCHQVEEAEAIAVERGALLYGFLADWKTGSCSQADQPRREAVMDIARKQNDPPTSLTGGGVQKPVKSVSR